MGAEDKQQCGNEVIIQQLNRSFGGLLELFLGLLSGVFGGIN